MSNYLYSANANPHDGFTQVTLLRDDNSIVVLERGKVYSLSASEFARLRNFIVLTPSGGSPSPPNVVEGHLFYGTFQNGDIPSWDTSIGAFVPLSGGGGGGGSGLPSNVLNKTANFTAADGDFVICDATAGAFTVTLPSTGAVIVYKDDASANAVGVDAAGSGVINGDTSDPAVELTADQAGVLLQSTGADTWKIVASVPSLGSAQSGSGVPIMQGDIATNLGATQTVTASGADARGLTGTLNADLAITWTGGDDGGLLYFLAVQGGAGGWTVSLNGEPVPVSDNAGDSVSFLAVWLPNDDQFVGTPGGVADASNVNVSPAVNGNADAQAVLGDHETRIDTLETGGGGGGAPTLVDAGNLGAAYSLDLSTDKNVWLVGTLNADCTITASGMAAGEAVAARLFLTQDGTGGWTATFADGAGSAGLAVSPTAGDESVFDASCVDGSEFLISAVGAIAEQNVPYPAMMKLKAWSFDPGMINGNAAFAADGTRYVVRVPVRSTFTINEIVYVLSSQITSPTTGGCWVSVYDLTGAEIGRSGDLGGTGAGQWGASPGSRRTAVAARPGKSLTVSDDVYVQFLSNGGSNPQFLAGGSTNSDAHIFGMVGADLYRDGSLSGSGNTTPTSMIDLTAIQIEGKSIICVGLN